MGQKRSHINKYASMMNRLSNIYFDMELAEYGIGCGQQFFLMRIEEQPGISLLSLAHKGFFDKGTTARAVKKLEEQGYVRRVTDEKDKRINRLYITDAAGPVLKEIHEMLDSWYRILTVGISDAERDATETIMNRMAENACEYIERLRKPEGKADCGISTKEMERFDGTE